jgi:hypothetical protein
VPLQESLFCCFFCASKQKTLQAVQFKNYTPGSAKQKETLQAVKAV